MVARWYRSVGKDHEARQIGIAKQQVNDVTGDLRAAQEFARHADVESTQIYTRVTKDRLIRAVGTPDYLPRTLKPGYLREAS